MATQVKTNASGNASNTGAPGPTPASAKKVVPQAPDQVTFVRRPSPSGYGMNGPQPSSINPGQQMISPLAANLKATVDDDGALDTVIARGTAKSATFLDDSQLRQIAAKNVPVRSDVFKNPNKADEKVPSVLGASNGQPVRQP